jgi:uncharacterized membrane protein YedE/YeeE
VTARAAAFGFGAAFGIAMSWGQFVDPDRIRDMLLLSDPYLYLMMGTAVAVGFVGVRLLRRVGLRALLTGEPVTWETAKPARRYVIGSAIFGVGWAVADTCPAPIAAQLAQGALWSLFTFAGVLVGILAYLRWQEEPAAARRRSPRARRGLASPRYRVD